MDASSQNSEHQLALELGMLLHEHKGGDVVVMDMGPLDFWTDFFIIATVTSSTHMSGLERHIKDFSVDKGLKILQRSRKAGNDRNQGSAEARNDEWRLLDMGGIVVHLMSPRSRSFYELERLWSAAPLIFRGDAHSSKSSYSTSSS